MYSNNEIGKRNPKFIIAAVITAVMVIEANAISTIITIESVFAYRNNQAASQASTCGNSQIPTNIGCQNKGSSIQGDDNAVRVTGQPHFSALPHSKSCL
jgi:hypothetical protein